MEDAYLLKIIESIVVVFLLVILRAVLIKTVKKFAKKSERVENRTGLILKYVSFATIFLCFLFLFFIWGVQLKDLGWVMSSVFAVIGIGFFAQWSILSNITSGIIMFFTFPYKIGDFIKIHDKEYDYVGYIEDIKAFHIQLTTTDGKSVVYPNSMLMQKGVSILSSEDVKSIETASNNEQEI